MYHMVMQVYMDFTLMPVIPLFPLNKVMRTPFCVFMYLFCTCHKSCGQVFFFRVLSLLVIYTTYKSTNVDYLTRGTVDSALKELLLPRASCHLMRVTLLIILTTYETNVGLLNGTADFLWCL